VCVIVHNCHTQHRIVPIIFALIFQTLLRCCLLEGEGVRIFTGWMLFLSLSQQRQSTEWNSKQTSTRTNHPPDLMIFWSTNYWGKDAAPCCLMPIPIAQYNGVNVHSLNTVFTLLCCSLSNYNLISQSVKQLTSPKCMPVFYISKPQ